FECQLDKIATELGLDPIEYRLRVLQPANSRTVNDLRITTMGLGDCVEAVRQATAWNAKRESLPNGKRIGVARSAYIQTAWLPSEAASEKLGVPIERLATAYRRVYDLKDPEKQLSFVEAANIAEGKHGTLVAAGSYTPPAGIGGSYKGAGVGPTPAYSYQASVAEVSVDLETGTLTVEKITTAHDCGRALNPANVEGQIEGSAYMGYGEIMVEEQIFRGGLHKKPSLLDYKLPTSLDTPELE